MAGDNDSNANIVMHENENYINCVRPVQSMEGDYQVYEDFVPQNVDGNSDSDSSQRSDILVPVESKFCLQEKESTSRCRPVYKNKAILLHTKDEYIPDLSTLKISSKQISKKKSTRTLLNKNKVAIHLKNIANVKSSKTSESPKFRN